MPNIAKSPFKLQKFIVKQFNIIRNPGKQGNVRFDIVPSAVVNRQQRFFQLTLAIKLEDKKGSYIIDILAIGDFQFDNVIDDGNLNGYFLTNAPALIFPYVRAYISAVTALSGLDAVNLPVMNLTSLKAELQKNIAEVEA
ncbi:MAG TPA: protein-export chaperone SecB [Sphingobacteriaceae bacterium]|nr:protein-export chaperone SecB [Sphingobacteriaceae bacterium]